MEFGTIINNSCLNKQDIGDDNYMRYVGWKANDDMKSYFSKNTVKLISRKVTEFTLGVHKDNLPIIVPDKNIYHVMSSVYDSFRPETGDIFTRYNIVKKNKISSNIQTMIDRVIEIITSHIKNDFETRYNNEKLSIWSTVYGDFNKEGLRQHPPIKVLNKRTNKMQFNFNY